jgi:putative DNA primase/helicase
MDGRKNERVKSIEDESDSLFELVEPFSEPVNGAELLDDLVGFINRFVVTEKHTTEAAAVWIVFTWLIDAVDISANS